MHITQFTERKIIKIMRKRIGNDFLFYWIIKENNVIINPDAVIDFKIIIKHRRTGSEIVAEFDVVNSSPSIKCENLLYLGIYDLIATWKTVDYSFDDDFRNSSADVQAFEIVSSSSSECETDLTVTSEIAIGFEGADAFEVWLKNGNEGKTYEDYIAFLQKPATDAAQAMVSNIIALEIRDDMCLYFVTPETYDGITFDVQNGNLIATI